MSENEILEELRGGGECPFDTAASLSDRVALSRQRVGEKLKRLAESGKVERCELKGAILYWDEEYYRQVVSGAEHGRH